MLYRPAALLCPSDVSAGASAQTWRPALQKLDFLTMRLACRHLLRFTWLGACRALKACASFL
eukprot:scaffold401121_cov10-Prasinocladus_malaysianus.AAC.1